MNELIGIIEIVVIFGLLLLTKKLFGKTGLIVWSSVALIVANIQVCKNIEIFGIATALGNVMFASTFLATDILTECYGAKEAKKSIIIGVASVILFLIGMQFTLLFRPSELDIIDTSMKTLFTLTPRVCISSLVMCALANMADVYLYDKLKKATNGKYMWLRNNICTIVCNGLENFGFMFLAFAGIFTFKDMIVMSLMGCVIEGIIALCDTPFLYLAKKIN